MITHRMIRLFAYRQRLWEATQGSPFSWKSKSQRLERSNRLKYLIWCSHILHTIGYISLSSFGLIRLVFIQTAYKSIDVTADSLLVFMLITMLFLCIGIFTSRQQHILLLNSFLQFDAKLCGKIIANVKESWKLISLRNYVFRFP